MKNGSLPVRECGLKFRPAGGVSCLVSVTPRAGVWIEISTLNLPFLMSCVTPRAGVWIEIPLFPSEAWNGRVTPRAGVWIEIHICRTKASSPLVTPRAGVWIEIDKEHCEIMDFIRHSPCGSVD